jgi:hypothetical protein
LINAQDRSDRSKGDGIPSIRSAGTFSRKFEDVFDQKMAEVVRQ